ncbi:MAG: radical SAM protein [Clostridia bacterium]|nr:radical SAM protein [Clostridia bacterium]
MSESFNPDVMNYLYARAGAQGIPLGGTFELTPVCNMNCRMCYIRMSESEMKSKGCLKTAEQWLQLAQQAKDAGMLFLLVTGGEPLLFPQFKELFMELKSMGLMVSINTNGTLIDDEMVEFFKNYPPYRINITLYGASNETYKRLCRFDNGYTRVINAIDKLKKAKLPVKINCSITPDNITDAKAVLSMAKDFSSPCSLGCYMFPPTRRDNKATNRFTPAEAGKYQAAIDKMRYENKDFQENIQKILLSDNGELKSYAPSIFRCRAGRSSFWITWQGKMNACGMMETFDLDPFKDGFVPCWQAVNKKISNSTALEGCEGCKDRAVCKVCPAIAAAETGDINKKPQYLCDMVEAWKKEMLAISQSE